MADTNMDDQMEAVFKSSRGEVDPVSGNEVPLGARPEEVRDDIPANLSEGEYIVPADVLRYYGVKFFEELRNEAKQGWQELDQGGRVGGDPSGMEMGGDELPFDISELQVIEGDDSEEQPQMNKGGYISDYAEGGIVDRDALQEEFPEAFTTDGAGSGQEYRAYTNAEGMTLSVRFVDGKPMSSIPAGYTASGESAAETAAPSRSRKRRKPAAQEPVEQKDWNTAELSDFGTYLDQKDSLLGKGVTALASSMNPLIGLAIGYAGDAEDRRVMESLDTRISAITDPKDPEYKKLVDMRSKLDTAINKDSMKDKAVRASGVFGGGKSMKDGLTDTSGDGNVSFADTWLGDTLGFDGEAGNQGASLSDSMGGDRRKFTPANTISTPADSIDEPPTATSATTSKVTTTPLTTTAEQDRAKKAADKLNKPLATGGR